MTGEQKRRSSSEAIAQNPPALKQRGFKLLRSSSVAVARKTRMGFNLIEAAIVLAVVGLVIGGIWVAAASLAQRRFEQQFMEGLLVLATNAQKYLSQRNACGGASLADVSQSPELWEIMYPKQWEQAGVYQRYPHSPYISCEGDYAEFPNEKSLSLTFWNSSDSYICNNLAVKINAVCARMGCAFPAMDWSCSHPGDNWVLAFRIGR